MPDPLELFLLKEPLLNTVDREFVNDQEPYMFVMVIGQVGHFNQYFPICY